MAKANSKKNNNALYIGIAIAVVVVVAIIVAVVLSTRGNNNNTGDTGNNSVTASEFSNIDIAIGFGDYEAMAELSKSIQNGEATGKVVKIDGIVSHPAVSYSVMESSEDGTTKIGTQFIIEGASEADYPKDKAHVVITGKIVEKEPLYYVIKTLPEYVEVK